MKNPSMAPVAQPVSLDNQVNLFRMRAAFSESMGYTDAAEANHRVAGMLVRLGDELAWEAAHATTNEQKLAWQKVMEHFSIRL